MWLISPPAHTRLLTALTRDTQPSSLERTQSPGATVGATADLVSRQSDPEPSLSIRLSLSLRRPGPTGAEEIHWEKQVALSQDNRAILASIISEPDSSGKLVYIHLYSTDLRTCV